MADNESTGTTGNDEEVKEEKKADAAEDQEKLHAGGECAEGEKKECDASAGEIGEKEDDEEKG